ncbi:MAG TPA: helix-turn-helix domain-containing protein [Longimicrobiaceae bacterium]|nr:helix-turn-helix domain-containing protein [Longimicrobiaceae bacterium]
MDSYHFSSKVLDSPGIPNQLRKLGREFSRLHEANPSPHTGVVVSASEVLAGRFGLPRGSKGRTTRYLIVNDVPEALLFRVVSELELRKPDQRAHLTSDEGAVRRMLVSLARKEPFLGIVDAYVWDRSLYLVCGDLTVRIFPLHRVPGVSALSADEQAGFVIDVDGSFLHWPDSDIHLGVSQILQQADPSHLADVAMARNQQDHTGAALRLLRAERGLRQADIPGLSERQVRRLEEGISRLRVEAAEKFAAAFGLELSTFLNDLASRAGAMRVTSPVPLSRKNPERKKKGERRTPATPSV